MAWHKFATIKTNFDGKFYSNINLFCPSAQGVNYEVHAVAENKPDTIAAIYSGSSLFAYVMDTINLALTDETANTEYDLWLDLDAQVYTRVTIASVVRGTIPSVNLSNSVLDVATYSLSNIGLETLTGITSLTALDTLDISNNNMTAAQVNAIVDDVFEMAVTNNISDGTLNITGNAAPTGDSLLAYNALVDFGWNSGTPITELSNIYEVQMVRAILYGSFQLTNNIDASATATWNSGAGFVPIGDGNNRFNGIVNSNGFKIENLYINRYGEQYQGLFGYISSGKVYNLLVNGEVVGSQRSGILAGAVNSAASIIQNCAVSGSFQTGNNQTGALVGYHIAGTVRDCYGIADGGFALFGWVTNISKIYNCFNYKGKFVNNVFTYSPNLLNLYQSEAYTTWTAGEYSETNIREYNGVVYRANTTTSEEPSSTATDWDVLDIKTLTAAEFRNASNFAYQPTGTEPEWNETDAAAGDYDRGTIVEDAGDYYISTVNDNAARPSTGGTGWIRLGFDFDDVWRMGKDYPELRAFISNIVLFLDYLYGDKTMNIPETGGILNIGALLNASADEIDVAANLADLTASMLDEDGDHISVLEVGSVTGDDSQCQITVTPIPIVGQDNGIPVGTYTLVLSSPVGTIVTRNISVDVLSDEAFDTYYSATLLTDIKTKTDALKGGIRDRFNT